MPLKNLVARLRGGFSRAQAERLWSTQHERKPGWAESYQSSWDAPWRRVLVKKLKELGTIESLLEIGCNAGPNLIAITRGLPSPAPRLQGIDINPQAVECANRFFKEQGWAHATACQGTMPEAAAEIPDRSWDAVISIAVLMHLAPDAFEATLKYALRIARRHAIFIDLHVFQPFLDARAGSPAKKFRDRMERDWWKCLSGYGEWEFEVAELPPEANRADVGDINAIIVGRRR